MPIPNPPFTVDDLLAETPASTIRAVSVSALKLMGIRADLWPAGDAASSILTDMSQKVADAYVRARAAIAAGWLPTATAGWLQWVAFYFYGVTKIEATFANGQVTLTNTGNTPYSYAAKQVTFQNVFTKKTYKNLDPVALVAFGVQIVAIEADVAGTASNADPGQITGLVTTMLGVTVSNAFPVRGIDAQSDEDLRTMCWNSLGARSVRGPRTAYAFAIQIAKNSVTGSPVNINRWTITSSSHTGQVSVVVAAPDGAPDANDVLGVADSIEQVARPECVTVTTTGAVAVPYTGAIVVYLAPQPGLKQATVQTAVAAAISTFFASPLTNPIGGLTADGITGVHATGIEGAAASAFPGIFAVDSPGDLALTAGQVATNNVTTITVRFASS